jgi:hypothetical protein
MTAVRFGDFVLDREARQLRRGGEAVSLSPKAYQLLDALVSSRPKALSKIALQDQLWPDTFVVEKNLVNLVAEIRRALGDDPACPRFVRTVQRFGYAFRDEPSPPPIATGADGRPVRYRLRWPDGRAQLGAGEHVLGRDPDLDLFVDAPGISRRHAAITITSEGATVRDLGSKNGTFVADRRIDAPRRLEHGDRIRLGSVELTFLASSTSRSTLTEPSPGS